MRILIVDNDNNTVETLKASLSRHRDLSVETALSGKDALKILSADPAYDLVVMDIMMPEVSGIDVCTAMSISEKMRAIPVLAMSALPIESKAFQKSLDKFSELSVIKGVIEKPFSMNDFVAKIRSLISK